eukprot:gnl/TRDRNA2_/TRDRNA2_80761_c1_seq1.p1 gnl/TRDRNA2_/TRDRNA2_80761_c1~~gnl/TRDRNA2_/TRDRNA2_80761_c1_seq1.p1  ORF type:complete len:326 (+),score=34.50 gnl/TRDRNA2_/TRDRNA2_80761_c1_seq1:116-979(+)
MALYPGDGTWLSMDIHGGLFRRKLQDGEIVWHSSPTLPMETTNYSYTDGGMIIGPDDIVYSCSNYFFADPWMPGVLRAVKLSDGKELWHQDLPHPCVSWPASDGTKVVVPVGALPSSTPVSYYSPGWMPESIRETIRKKVHEFSLLLGDYQCWLWGCPTRPIEVYAYESKTGQRLWALTDLEPWRQFAAKGDEEHLEVRLPHKPMRPVCGPASWSAPTIDGEGTVFAAAMDGWLYAIRDVNGDGKIDVNTEELDRLNMDAASLHPGTSFAPGMMAFASCDGVHVFKY